MAQPHITDTEILTEHLGYAPVSLLDSIINVVNSLADRTLDRVEQGLAGASAKTLGFEKALKKQQQQQQQKQNPSADPPRTADEAAKFEVADGVHKLETLLCNAIDKNFDIFELYVMRYLICLSPDARPWLRLSHYGAHDFDAPARDGAPTPESVNAVRRSLQGSQRLNGYMKAVKAHLQETGASAEEITKFEKGAQTYVKETLLPNFKDWEFFTGESMNPDGAIVLMNYREDGVTPYIVVFKHGLKEEKV
ncbi:hypothetical protein BN1723_012566 [Verticillium longisporum]|uniref:TCTP domain-containing protein n=1 Tax=Verticillium longisporum TaxID=100787 RepID=A0A0G4LJ64_VERLO|nr:hypothetical protein BN1723_012566 [Verticillium longisporum]